MGTTTIPEIFIQYKNALRQLERHCQSFNLLEATSDVNGATSVIQIRTLLTSVIEFIKSSLDAAMKPFDPASLDNYMSTMRDMGTSLQVFEYTPSELSFDARDVLSIKDLSEIVDDIFRCCNACWHPFFKGEFPHALCTVDITVNNIIYNALSAVEGKNFSGVTMTGAVPTKDVISFTKLDQQKYFSSEEKEAIRAKKDAEQAAAKRAAEEEELEREASEAKGILKKMFEDKDHYNQIDFDLVDPKIVLKALPALTFMAQHITNSSDLIKAAKTGFFNTPYTSDGKLTEGNFACAAEIVAMVNKGNGVPMIRNEDNCSVYTDKESDKVVDVGNILIFFYD